MKICETYKIAAWNGVSVNLTAIYLSKQIKKFSTLETILMAVALVNFDIRKFVGPIYVVVLFVSIVR